MPHRPILNQLANLGFRRTKIREAIIRIFAANHAPLSVPELIERHATHFKANKTTFYREVDFLTRQKILSTISLGDGTTRYELTDRTHHHHLVCEACGRIADVELTENFGSETRRIKKDHAFTVRRHTLEFFGHCANCLNT